MASGSTSSTWNAGQVLFGDPCPVPKGLALSVHWRPLGARSVRTVPRGTPPPGVPQPGRAPSKINGPSSLGKNSMTEDLRACGECAGFAAAPEADHGGDHGHADAPISEALCLAAAAVLFAVTASARSQAATGAQASGQRAAAADCSSGERPRQRGGAPPDDASANLASGSSVNAVLTKPWTPRAADPVIPSMRARVGSPRLRAAHPFRNVA